MATHQITDERLRSYLDTNQLARERMCQAVLSLDKRFRDIHTRNPRGGRDGGRDLEAIYEDGRKAWAAVGFQNSVSDSKKNKKEANRKFKSDYERAKAENPSLAVFVFFTNVYLTVGEKEALVKYAKARGTNVVDIYDRERIRIVLDSTDGFAIRFQYLEISLSKSEQAAFFARWGSDIECLITKSITAVETQLARVEFILERQQPLTSFSYYILLNQSVSREELGHFRVDFLMHFMPPRTGYSGFHLGICDDRGGIDGDKVPRQDCMSSIGWVDDRKGVTPRKIFHKSHGIIDSPIRQLSATIYESFLHMPLLDSKLGDLDGNMFAFFVNDRLSKLVERIMIVANEYLIWSANREDISIDLHKRKCTWPYKFSDEELKEPWVRIMPKSTHSFNFSSTTPYRLYRASKILVSGHSCSRD